jgi:hypothetical protein
MPIDFLGVRFGTSNGAKELVDGFLFPYMITNGVDLESIKKETAKMNFLTYCDGTLKYEEIEKLLIGKLQGLNFNMEQIDSILSMITLVAVSTDRNVDKFVCTSVKIKDINDGEVLEESEINKLAPNENFTYSVSPSNPDSILYLYRGNGEHSVKAHLSDDSIAKPVLCALIIAAIKKAEKGETLTSEELLDLMEAYAKDDITDSKKIMNEIDKKLSYEGVRKYDKSTLELRKKLDDTIKVLASRETSLEYEKMASRQLKAQNLKLQQGIEEYCSKNTKYKILKTIGWQFSEEELKKIDSAPSDKEFVEAHLNEESSKSL